MGEDPSYEFSLRGYLSVLRRHWLLVLLVTAITVGGVLAYSLIKEATYTATAVLRFEPVARSLPCQRAPDAGAQAAMITAPERTREVRRNVGGTSESLRNGVETSVEPGTSLVEIEASFPQPERAADVANAFARETRRAAVAARRQRLEDAAKDVATWLTKRLKENQRVSQGIYVLAIRSITRAARSEGGRIKRREVAGVEVVQPATPPASPASPRPVRNSALALVLGLIIGSIAALARDYRARQDRRVIGPQAATDHDHDGDHRATSGARKAAAK
jgi:uncharacterized protein involved in exopolysaccharide biosynthesis